MSDTIKLADKTNLGFMRDVEDALKDAINLIGKEGAFEKGTKVLILALDDTDGEYDVTFVQAGLKASEMIALCETAKVGFLRDMGYI